MSKVFEMSDGISTPMGKILIAVDRNFHLPASVDDPLVAATADTGFRIEDDIFFDEDEFTDQFSVLTELFDNFRETDVFRRHVDMGFRDVLYNNVNFNYFRTHRLQVTATVHIGPAGKVFTLLLPILTVGG